jgi:hypothetical protein
MRKSIVRAGLVITLAAGALLGVAAPAEAWTHGLGLQSYWAPGPGTTIHTCHVSTALYKHPTGDVAELWINNPNFQSACKQGFIQIVTWDGHNLLNSDWVATNFVTNGTATHADAFGANGNAVVGANVQIVDVWDHWTTWQIGVY